MNKKNLGFGLMRLPMQEISGISREKVERALAEICK